MEDQERMYSVPEEFQVASMDPTRFSKELKFKRTKNIQKIQKLQKYFLAANMDSKCIPS